MTDESGAYCLDGRSHQQLMDSIHELREMNHIQFLTITALKARVEELEHQLADMNTKYMNEEWGR